MTASEGVRSAEQWRQYLADYSADVLGTATAEELAEVNDAQRAAIWLGFDGAGAEQLTMVEQRLGTTLPPSYRSFLAVSDGWLNLGPFLWTMRTTSEIGWLRNADPELYDILRDDPTAPDSVLADRALLISGSGDCQYWLLDSGDVSADGEWAAYTWSSWSPGLDERYDSFAALVDAERDSYEQLSGRDGRPVQPDGADALVAESRELALRGEVDAAAEAFARATVKGSGTGAYLGAILEAFLTPETAHHTIRNTVFGHPHVIEEIGLDQVRAEAVPLFLHRESIRTYPNLLTGILTDDEIAAPDRFTPPKLPEPPAFQAALDHARQQLRSGLADHAWQTVHDALPGWRSDSPHRVAPVILLTDPHLRHLITPDRARTIVTTPRGRNRPAP